MRRLAPLAALTSRKESVMAQDVISPTHGPMHDQPTDEHEPTRQLVREALDQTRDLVRLEVLLARNEVENELSRAKAGAIALSSAAVAALASFTLFMVAIALAFSIKWLAALIIGIILLFVAGLVGFAGRKLLPTKPLGETSKRIGADLNQLKERVQ